MTTVSIHVLQTVPPSCINRDAQGNPKSTVYGGVRRLRVSSQAWKRSTREMFNAQLHNRGWRENGPRPVTRLARHILDLDDALGQDTASQLARAAFRAAGVDLVTKRDKAKGDEESPVQRGNREALVFFSVRQYQSLAEAALHHRDTLLAAAMKYDAERPDDKIKPGSSEDDLRGARFDGAAVKATTNALTHVPSYDVALFGRMLADNRRLDVEGAATVAHAFSVDPADAEYDYFTAVDDSKKSGDGEDAGAAMIGTRVFSAGTLYRHATVNTGMLVENLGGTEDVPEAVASFLDAFIRSMPTGSQRSYGNRTLPEAVVVELREDQAVSGARAFTRAIEPEETDTAIGVLLGYLDKVARVYGAPAARLVMNLDADDSLTVDELVASVAGHVRRAL